MKKLLILLLPVILLSASCRKAPMLNLFNQGSPQKVTMAQMETAILEAGKSLNWRMAKMQPGLIEGTLLVRSHTAVVNISYSEDKYSIVYKSSINLKADGTGKIHKNYNAWIRALDQEIRNRLMEFRN